MIPPYPAIFLDRDGTINRDVDYLTSPDQLELLPSAGQALHSLQQQGYLLIVVSNQSAVARGMLSEDQLLVINRKLEDMLRPYGVTLAGSYYCPHHPTVGVGKYRQACQCRKPRTGLFIQASNELQVDLANSWAIGDRLRDLLGPAELGCKTILVRTGYGATQEQELTVDPTANHIDLNVCDDLWAASQLIISQAHSRLGAYQAALQ